jgi:hypothetical protein
MGFFHSLTFYMSTFAESTEIIKNWVEILAIVLAGVWATFTFVIKDSPNLHQATESGTQVYIDSLGQDTLSAEVIIDFKNIGQQIVSIDSAEIEYWIVPRSSIVSKQYFNADDIFRQRQSDFRVPVTSLNGRYTSDQLISQAMRFFVKKDLNHAVVFRTTLHVSRKGILSSSHESLYSYWYRFRVEKDEKSKES